MLEISMVLVALLFSAFFSGIEIAFISANKLRIGVEKKQGVYSARLLSRFIDQPTKFITTMLLGNNAALVIYGVFMAKILEPFFTMFIGNQAILVLVQTIISTIIVLFTAEFLPKAIFKSNPNFFLHLFAIPLTIFWVLLYIPMILTDALSRLCLKLFKVEMKDEIVTYGRVDLEHYIEEVTTRAVQREEELEHEFQIFQNALEFSKIKARDCMVPRTDICAMDIESEVEELRDQFIKTGLSKILIYRDSVDNIIGYVHSAELFKRPDHIKSILLPVSIVPETMAVNDVLEMLVRQNRSIAVVVDEFGGTAGIITTEDIVEEIFGDIEDEHDIEIASEEEIDENTWLLPGRLEIDDINEKYRLNLPENEAYGTLAGLVLHRYESIPEAGSIIRIGDYIVTIVEVSDNRIDLLKVERSLDQ